ncbi:LamG domain-containing protein [Adhaeretor mobilis]|nr:lichenase [Adhaeretor mobilis]
MQPVTRLLLPVLLIGLLKALCPTASQAAEVATSQAPAPALNESEYCQGGEFALVFDSNFAKATGTQPETRHWRRESMGKSVNAGQHRMSPGRRHTAWYDKFHEKTSYIRDGVLVQRGFIADEDIPGFVSRDQGGPRDHAYDDPDPRDAAKGTVNLGDFEFHTSWFTTYALKAVDGALVPVQAEDKVLPHGKYWGQPGMSDTPSPNITFSPGTFFEIEVNFEGMQALAHRHSFWLMPTATEFVAYDEDPANGLEIDIYEHELTLEPELAESLTPNPNDMLLMKCLGGATTPHATENELVPDLNTNINVPGINVGWHKIGLLWTHDQLVWFVDGVAKVRDTQLVPQVGMYLIISREANTGALRSDGNNAHNLLVDGEKIPSDAGLWGRNAMTPGNRELVKAGKDDVKVRSVRAWKVLQ